MDIIRYEVINLTGLWVDSLLRVCENTSIYFLSFVPKTGIGEL
ncbi:hypothetical protein [Mobilitalea sibirica]|nr:hypothetical protein [Mobilitalea sibirica]